MRDVCLKKHLHECLRKEVMMSNKPFSWFATLHKAVKCPDRRFYFWWRIASYLYKREKKPCSYIAQRINRNLIRKYNTEIQLSAHIGPGLKVTHFLSIVINGISVIGKNFKIRQNCTIGISGSSNKSKVAPFIIIGNDVEICANSCVIGDNLSIGNNVTIGAMSFINKDIPDNNVVYTEKTLKMNLKEFA